MTRPLEPRVGIMPPGTGLPVAMMGLVWGAVGLLGVVYGAGAAASWLTGHGWQVPPFDTASVRQLLDAGPSALWPQVPAGLVLGLAALALAAVAVPILVMLRRIQGARGERGLERALAGADELVALTPHGVAERARRLRVSLQATPVRRVPARDAGVPLGRLGCRGPELRASWEDVLLAVMAPRAGKTTSLAVPAVLDAPGAVVATSNKADLWAATASLREVETGEAVWVFDPQGIAATPCTWWWNPLRGLDTVEEASRLAGHFIQEVRGDKSSRDFWTSAAHDLLTGLLLAAAAGGRSLDEVYEWLNDPVVPTPAMLLHEAGHPAAAASLVGRQNGAPETRDGIYETARTAAQCLRDRRIMDWVSPSGGGFAGSGGLSEFDARAFVDTRQSLYLLSKDGAGAAAPLVAALADRVMREAVRAAERRGGRLDPPMVLVLDEAANVCRVADLPDLYSHLGSRGIAPITILQSYRQGVRVWGEAGMDALWSAATIKVIGAGIDDARFADDVSRLVGEHDVSVRSYSQGHRERTATTSLRRQRILPPEQVRALPRGRALLLATGARAALLYLQPYFRGPAAARVAQASDRAEHELTQRARQWPAGDPATVSTGDRS